MADNALRILILDGELTCRGSSLLALRIARGLEKRELETALVCTGSRDIEPGLLEGVRLHKIPGYPLPLWGRIVLQSMRHRLSEQPPDVIHLFDSRYLNQGVRLASALNCPLILTVSSHEDAAFVRYRRRIPVVRAILSVSESVRQSIPASPLTDNVLHRVILPGVQIPETPIDAILDDERPPVIGMAGPLDVSKGGAFFLRACHEVIRQGHQIRIVIAGSGPEEHNLRRLAASLQISSELTFVDGGVSMKGFLEAIDIFCMPSLQQGIGVVMLEAMALARPVIASGVGGLLSVIHDHVDGMIVPPSNSHALAVRIAGMLNDREGTRRIALAGQSLVASRFSESRMLDELIGVYQSVLKTSSHNNSGLDEKSREFVSRQKSP